MALVDPIIIVDNLFPVISPGDAPKDQKRRMILKLKPTVSKSPDVVSCQGKLPQNILLVKALGGLTRPNSSVSS